jgi:hypothetical protein
LFHVEFDFYEVEHNCLKFDEKGTLMSSNSKCEKLEDIKSETKERDFTSAVLSTAGALVVVLDRQGRIVRFNCACEKLTGYLYEEVKGKPFWDLFLLRNEMDQVKVVFENLRS